jgi:hypothetical protein
MVPFLFHAAQSLRSTRQTEHGALPHPHTSKPTEYQTDRAWCPSSSAQLKDYGCQPNEKWLAGDWETLHGADFNLASLPVVEEAGLPILNTWNATAPLYRFHLKLGDCTHFCSTGAYEASQGPAAPLCFFVPLPYGGRMARPVDSDSIPLDESHFLQPLQRPSGISCLTARPPTQH